MIPACKPEFSSPDVPARRWRPNSFLFLRPSGDVVRARKGAPLAAPGPLLSL